jgi:hypothetical protein
MLVMNVASAPISPAEFVGDPRQTPRSAARGRPPA